MTDTKQTETRREVAERIAKRATKNPCANPSCCPRTAHVADVIEAALKDRDQRAITIMNRFALCRDHDLPSHCVQCDLRHKATAAIRNGE